MIKSGMEKYIQDYIKALGKQHIESNRNLCKYSTLQNYHDELGIIDITSEVAAAQDNDKKD